MALLTVAALAAVVGALLLRPGSGVGTRQAELEALRDQLLRERAEASTSAPGATDPVEAEARRELERLYRRTGVGEPTTDASGQVRLRTGGSMDRAEYERYRARAGMR